MVVQATMCVPVELQRPPGADMYPPVHPVAVPGMCLSRAAAGSPGGRGGGGPNHGSNPNPGAPRSARRWPS